MSVSAQSRRVKFAVRSVVIGVSVTLICLFAGVIAARLPMRIDATATREHMLSPRTQGLLKGLKDPYEIVVAVNGAAIDAGGARRTQDVLDAFERTSPKVKVTMIDVSSTRGVGEMDSLLSRLGERYRGELGTYSTVIGATSAEIAAMSGAWAQLSDRLEAMGRTVPPAGANAGTLIKFCTDSAAISRLIGQDLSAADAKAKAAVSSKIGQSAIPAVDEAAAELRKALTGASTQIKGILEGLDAVAGAKSGNLPEAYQNAAGPLARDVRARRDDLARRIAALDDLPRLPVTAVARLLERSSAAVVIGPPGAARGGVTGIDVSSIFPARSAASQGPAPDLRGRTEDLFTSALTALASADTPIVVLVHGTDSKLGPQFAIFKGLVERLALRGIDTIEWAAALEPDPPALTALNPGGTRPVVYVTLPATAETSDTAQRMLKLAAGLKRLSSDGRNMLVSVNPSGMPGIGQADPLVEWLEEWGVKADTGRPLLMQQSTPAGRQVSADMVFTDPRSTHPVAVAITGLATDLLWAIPLASTGAGRDTWAPIVQVDRAGGNVWGESQWAEYRRVRPEQRALISNPPAPDSARDDTQGPWTIAAALQRPAPSGASGTSGSGTQRVVVVGSNGWFFDEIAGAAASVDGRSQLVLPGNYELFEASVYWLAGQDQRVSTSAQASAVALIPQVSGAKLAAIRWGLIAGVPVLVLLIGAVWRLVRG